jgi:hypothetical protein
MYQEEIDKALGKSQSISFNDLWKIRHLRRVIFAMVCLTVNYMTSRGMSAKIQVSFSEHLDSGSCEKYNLGVNNILNTDLLGGILMMILGYSSSFKFFSGKRITLIVGSIIFVVIWNILWVILSDIYMSESS